MTDPTVLRADIATAARSVAPLWPLRSFVAVNPLRGLEHRAFDGACARAQEWFDADTHLARLDHEDVARIDERYGLIATHLCSKQRREQAR